MRYKHPKSQGGASGYYGGIGTRPSPDVWTPGPENATAEDEPVPRRFRRLRLRARRNQEKQEQEDKAFPWGLVMAGVIVLIFLVVAVQTFRSYGSHYPWLR